MTNRKAFYFFLFMTLISLVIFLGFTWHTHRQVEMLTNADELDEQVVAGKRVFQDKNCNNCHTILGFGVYYAPDLTNVYKRIGAGGIKTAVLRPEEVFASSFRKMPNLDVTKQEATDLVAFLKWVSNIENNDWPPQEANEADMTTSQRRLTGAMGLSHGAAAFKEQCMNCHSLGDVGGSMGPALDNIDKKYNKSDIKSYIADPTSVDPDSNMPAQTNVSDEARQAIAEFLMGNNVGR